MRLAVVRLFDLDCAFANDILFSFIEMAALGHDDVFVGDFLQGHNIRLF
jgi:hypothetical protein